MRGKVGLFIHKRYGKSSKDVIFLVEKLSHIQNAGLKLLRSSAEGHLNYVSCICASDPQT